jgi:flagellar biosynthesis/type III secretory pathway chaperone
MRAATAGLTDLLEQLAKVLDEEQSLLERRLLELQSLSESIVKRDEEWMAQLMEQIEQTQRRQEQVDAQLRLLRARLGVLLGCGPEVRMSDLAIHVEGPQWAAIQSRRERIIDTMRDVRRQHLQTSMLLLEASRINRMLMDSMLPSSPSVMTYGQGGSETWRGEGGLMDAEL